MSRSSLSVEKRDASGKSPVARRLRATGRVPGCVYGAGEQVSFSADALELNAVLRHGANLVDLDIEGAKKLTVVKSYQVHPVRGNVMHIDLQEVTMDQTVTTVVQLHLTGESLGAKAGGMVTQGARELHIESRADSIPDEITYDISHIDLGETIILRDVPMPDGTRALDDEGMMVVTITVPRGAKGLKRAKDADGEDGAAEGDAPAADAGDSADA